MLPVFAPEPTRALMKEGEVVEISASLIRWSCSRASPCVWRSQLFPTRRRKKAMRRIEACERNLETAIMRKVV